MANGHEVLALLVCVTLLAKVQSLSFTLSAGVKKCLREEVHKDVLVTGEYKLSDSPIKTHLNVSRARFGMCMYSTRKTRTICCQIFQLFRMNIEEYFHTRIFLEEDGKGGQLYPADQSKYKMK